MPEYKDRSFPEKQVLTKEREPTQSSGKIDSVLKQFFKESVGESSAAAAQRQLPGHHREPKGVKKFKQSYESPYSRRAIARAEAEQAAADPKGKAPRPKLVVNRGRNKLTVYPEGVYPGQEEIIDEKKLKEFLKRPLEEGSLYDFESIKSKSKKDAEIFTPHASSISLVSSFKPSTQGNHRDLLNVIDEGILRTEAPHAYARIKRFKRFKALLSLIKCELETLGYTHDVIERIQESIEDGLTKLGAEGQKLTVAQVDSYFQNKRWETTINHLSEIFKQYQKNHNLENEIVHFFLKEHPDSFTRNKEQVRESISDFLEMPKDTISEYEHEIGALLKQVASKEIEDITALKEANKEFSNLITTIPRSARGRFSRAEIAVGKILSYLKDVFEKNPALQDSYLRKIIYDPLFNIEGIIDEVKIKRSKRRTQAVEREIKEKVEGDLPLSPQSAIEKIRPWLHDVSSSDCYDTESGVSSGYALSDIDVAQVDIATPRPSTGHSDFSQSSGSGTSASKTEREQSTPPTSPEMKEMDAANEDGTATPRPGDVAPIRLDLDLEKMRDSQKGYESDNSKQEQKRAASNGASQKDEVNDDGIATPRAPSVVSAHRKPRSRVRVPDKRLSSRRRRRPRTSMIQARRIPHQLRRERHPSKWSIVHLLQKLEELLQKKIKEWDEGVQNQWDNLQAKILASHEDRILSVLVSFLRTVLPNIHKSSNSLSAEIRKLDDEVSTILAASDANSIMESRSEASRYTSRIRVRRSTASLPLDDEALATVSLHSKQSIAPAGILQLDRSEEIDESEVEKESVEAKTPRNSGEGVRFSGARVVPFTSEADDTDSKIQPHSDNPFDNVYAASVSNYSVKASEPTASKPTASAAQSGFFATPQEAEKRVESDCGDTMRAAEQDKESTGSQHNHRSKRAGSPLHVLPEPKRPEADHRANSSQRGRTTVRREDEGIHTEQSNRRDSSAPDMLGTRSRKHTSSNGHSRGERTYSSRVDYRRNKRDSTRQKDSAETHNSERKLLRSSSMPRDDRLIYVEHEKKVSLLFGAISWTSKPRKVVGYESDVTNFEKLPARWRHSQRGPR